MTKTVSGPLSTVDVTVTATVDFGFNSTPLDSTVSCKTGAVVVVWVVDGVVAEFVMVEGVVVPTELVPDRCVPGRVTVGISKEKPEEDLPELIAELTPVRTVKVGLGTIVDLDRLSVVVINVDLTMV